MKVNKMVKMVKIVFLLQSFRYSMDVTTTNCGEFINKIIVTSLINYAVTYVPPKFSTDLFRLTLKNHTSLVSLHLTSLHLTSLHLTALHVSHSLTSFLVICVAINSISSNNRRRTEAARHLVNISAKFFSVCILTALTLNLLRSSWTHASRIS